MSKQPRHQTVISRQSDSEFSDDHWLREFEASLQKTSVQPKGKSTYDEITSIMNTRSKYPSVQAAVDDMMHRSGLSTYLETVKESQEHVSRQKPTKTAQHKDHSNMPRVIQEIPGAARTLDNIVKESKGNLPISAILQRLRALHAKDTADESVWDDEKLLHLISQLNLEAKKNNPGVFENFDNLGKTDHANLDTDIDASNTDAFNILMPAKI
jgi:hypothetical protein